MFFFLCLFGVSERNNLVFLEVVALMLLSGAGSEMPCQSLQLNRILRKFIARKEFTRQSRENSFSEFFPTNFLVR